MPSVCGHMVINCDKSMKSANLLPSVYKEIHMKYLHSESRQSLVELKQKFKYFPTNTARTDLTV